MFHDLWIHCLDAVRQATLAVVLPLPFFFILALAVKRRRLLADIRRAMPETRINILIHFVDALAVAPLLIVVAAAMDRLFETFGLTIVPESVWQGIPTIAVGIAGVILGDFIAYWRHRLEHTPFLWPAHAIHHSDKEMTWLAIFRFHPINRFSSLLVDTAFILAMGLPPYAVIVNALVRHYYGAFIHTDLPWTFGPFGKIFVSPAMHRWHHAVDKRAYNTNFTTVFSFIDLAFGTYRVPGPCEAPLGVAEDIGQTVTAQMLHPFKPSSYRYLAKMVRSRRERRAAARMDMQKA